MIPGAPAARSHAIAVGDTIISIDGVGVDSSTPTATVVALLLGDDSAKTTVQLNVRHGDKSQRHVELGRMPITAIFHRKRLFELFCEIQDVLSDTVRLAVSSGEGSHATSTADPGLIDPVNSHGAGPQSHRLQTFAQNFHIHGKLTMFVGEAINLWTRMVEEEDQRMEFAQHQWDADICHLQEVLSKLKGLMLVAAEERENADMERAETEACIDAMQDELAEHSDLLRVRLDKIRELEALLVDAQPTLQAETTPLPKDQGVAFDQPSLYIATVASDHEAEVAQAAELHNAEMVAQLAQAAALEQKYQEERLRLKENAAELKRKLDNTEIERDNMRDKINCLQNAVEANNAQEDSGDEYAPIIKSKKSRMQRLAPKPPQVFATFVCCEIVFCDSAHRRYIGLQ